MKLFVVVIFIISLILNVWLITKSISVPAENNNSTKLEADEDKFSLLASNLHHEAENDLLIRFIELRQQLKAELKEYGTDFSLYFQYLPTGVSIGINDKVEYNPASLIKVPMVMSYYKQMENSGISSDRIVTIQEDDIDKSYGSLWKKGVGYKITLSEVVKLMLEDSDNTATFILNKQIKSIDFEDVYTNLDLEYADQGKYIVTAFGYTSILKSLYYASIINKEHSQLILSYLTRAKDNDKLPAGISKNIVIAHKIGIDKNTNTYQDCGIVYVPKRPYVLCMISKGEEDISTARMKKASKSIFDYISSAKN